MKKILFSVTIVCIFFISSFNSNSNILDDKMAAIAKEIFANSKPDIRQEGEKHIKGDCDNLWFPEGEGSTWTYEIPPTGDKIVSVKTRQMIDGQEYYVIKQDGPMIDLLYGTCFGEDTYFSVGKFNPLLTFRIETDQYGGKFLYGYAKDYNKFLEGRAEAIEGVKKIEVLEQYQEEWLLGFSPFIPCKGCKSLGPEPGPVFGFWVFYKDGTKKLFEVSWSEFIEHVAVPGGENYFVELSVNVGPKTSDSTQDFLDSVFPWTLYLDDGGGIIGVAHRPSLEGTYINRKLINYSLTPEKKSGIGVDIPSDKVVTTWGNVKKQ